MKKVLLVYENIPESTEAWIAREAPAAIQIYKLEVKDEDLKWMSLTHGRYINSDMPKKNEKACDRLSVYLEEEGAIEVDNSAPIDIAGFDIMIHTGFVL